MSQAALHLASTPSTTSKRKPASKSKAKNAPAHKPASELKRYALAGVLIMSGLSAVLNAYANALHSSNAAIGAIIGVVIPLIVLILGKVAGLLYKQGHYQLAYVAASAGAGLLALSVWHCATSIALLTGSPVILALPMAVAIDVGFCASEMALLVAK